MTKKQWIDHMIEATGITPGATADWRSIWTNEGHRHMKENPDCPECAARRKTRMATKNRNWKDEAYKAVGMKKVKGALGGTYWEDIFKYGTKEEIEFLRECKEELLKSRMLGSLIEKFPEFKDKVMKLFKLDEVGIGKLTYLDDRALLRQYKQFLIGLKIEPTITALIDYIKNQKTGLAKF